MHLHTRTPTPTLTSPPPAQPLPRAERASDSPGLCVQVAELYLVTELKGSEQQERPSGGAVYSPVDGVQGLRPQKPVKYPSTHLSGGCKDDRDLAPCMLSAHLFFMYRIKSGCSSRYLSNRKAS